MKKFCKFIGYMMIIFTAFVAVYNYFLKDEEENLEPEDLISVNNRREYIDLD